MKMNHCREFGKDSAIKADEREREPRTRRLLRAQLMSSRVGTARIVIHNLSSCGLGGKCDEVLYKGEEVAVLLVNVGAIDAIVMWVKNRAFGLQFRQTIDPESALAAPMERIVKPYEVPAYFRPEISTYRPGFSRK